MTRLGNAIRQIRAGRGESELEFALRIGVSPNIVEGYELGDVIPTQAILAHIEAAAGDPDAQADLRAGMAESPQPVTAERGSPLTAEMDISHEEQIVWVRGGPADYPYLRESFALASTRRRPIRYRDNTLVAYATLADSARSVSPGQFQRRIWTFQFGRDGRLSPMQGVKPGSVVERQRSERI